MSDDDRNRSTWLDVSARWLVAIVVTGVAATVAERVAALVFGSTGMLSFVASLTLMSGEVALATAWTVVAAVTTGIAGNRTKNIDSRDRAFGLLSSALMALAALAVFVPVGSELSSGPWISQQSFAWVVTWGVPLAGAGTVGLAAAARIFAFLRGRFLSGGTVLLAVGLIGIVADTTILPGLYVSAHVALHAVSVLFLLLGVTLALGTRTFGWSALLPSLLICASPVVWLTSPQGIRAELVAKSAAATHFLHLSADGDGAPAGTVRSALSRLEEDDATNAGEELRRRDFNVLMIVVDTMRADATWPLRGEEDAHFSRPGDTPFVDEWLKDAVVFDRAYAQASTTKRSVPALFRSLRTWEEPSKSGIPLGVSMARTDRETHAVVNSWFFQRRHRRVEHLLDGFDNVHVYRSTVQGEIVDFTRQTLSNSEKPWFAWVHFYGLHSPGFDGKLQSKKDPGEERYRRSLRWLDGRLRELVEGLRADGELQNTVVVLASDHGEALGANDRRAHGTTVFEEEVRVPLAFWVPGASPRRDPDVACNIDIVPTLHDLIGEPRAHHRGTSLLGRIAGSAAGGPNRCYMEDRTGRIHAVVNGDRKLVYDAKADTISVFDLASDPTEGENLFGEDPEADAELLDLLCLENPALCSGAAAAALDFTAAIDLGETGGPAWQVWAALAARADEDDESLSGTLFEAVDRELARLALLDHAFDQEAGDWERRLRRHLADLPSERRSEFVRQLAATSQPEFAHSWVASQLQGAASDAEIHAWLTLVSQWTLPEETYGRVLIDLAGRLDQASLGYQVILLQAIARLEGPQPETREGLASVASLLGSPSARVRAAAARAVGNVGDPSAVGRLRRLAMDDSESLTVRGEALSAVTRLDPESAGELVLRVGRDPRLTWSAIEEAETIGDPSAVRFLRWASKRHRNSWVRARARRALKRVRKNK